MLVSDKIVYQAVCRTSIFLFPDVIGTGIKESQDLLLIC